MDFWKNTNLPNKSFANQFKQKSGSRIYKTHLEDVR